MLHRSIIRGAGFPLHINAVSLHVLSSTTLKFTVFTAVQNIFPFTI